MQSRTTDVERVINAYCGAQGGARVTGIGPDGYSIGAPTEAYNFEEWATQRVEAAFHALASRCKHYGPSVAGMREVILQIYWDSVDAERTNRCAGVVLQAVREEVEKEMMRNPLPQSMAA